jgi:RIO kinase 1
MRIPDRLVSLTDEGIVEDVVRPLMSGKEAQVYLVVSGGEQRVAKVYKEAHDRSFKQRAQYTEGRVVRNTRDQRAMTKRTRHGRDQDEAAWRAAEVDVIYRLRAAGVRVPTPHHFIDGVLIMELITDGEGNPAPRLGDVTFDAAGATKVFDHLLCEVVRMLCAGVVHGDLSNFNVLMGSDGPVIIDFPQAVNASSNQNARKLLLRDVDNLQRFLAEYVPGRAQPAYAQEMWNLYQRGELTPEARLTGRFRAEERQANTEAVLALISDAEQDERRRRQNLGLSMRGTARRVEVPVPQKGRRDQAPPARRDQSGPPRRDQPAQMRREPGPAQRDAPLSLRRDQAGPAHRDASLPLRREQPVQPRRDPHAQVRGADQSVQPRRDAHGPMRRDPQLQSQRDPQVQNRQPAVQLPRAVVAPDLGRGDATASERQHGPAAQPAKNRKRRRRRRKNRGPGDAGPGTHGAGVAASGIAGSNPAGNRSNTP